MKVFYDILGDKFILYVIKDYEHKILVSFNISEILENTDIDITELCEIFDDISIEATKIDTEQLIKIDIKINDPNGSRFVHVNFIVNDVQDSNTVEHVAVDGCTKSRFCKNDNDNDIAESIEELYSMMDEVMNFMDKVRKKSNAANPNT